MTYARISFAVVLMLCILTVWLGRHGTERSTETMARSLPTNAESTFEIEPDLERGATTAERSSTAASDLPPVVRGYSFPDAQLIELLRATATAHAGGQLELLKQDLEELLGDGGTPLQVLELLKGGNLAQDPLAIRGGILLLGVAIQRYNAGDAILGVDGRAFLLAVLDALPDIHPPEQGELIAQIVRARIRGLPVLDLSYLPKILELRRLHPDQARIYSALLENIGEELGSGDAYEQFYALFVNDTSDPMAVRVSLSALLRSKGSAFIPLAEEMFAGAKGNSALRHAITQAIATSAPVPDAVKSMTRLADSSQLPEFLTLGARPGAVEALGTQYNDLVASDANPIARRMLVSAMSGETEAGMLGIATTDPDSAVRLQALLTLTVEHPVSGQALDTLIQSHDNRGDPRSGLPTYGAVWAAGNIMRHSGGAERDRAQKFLMQIAYDSMLSDADRLSAVANLKRTVPKGTFSDLTIGGKPVE
jgi:hypothetical protein